MNERQVRDDYDRICRRAFAGGLPLRREPRPRPRWRVNWLVVALCAVVLTWFVIQAIALRRGL